MATGRYVLQVHKWRAVLGKALSGGTMADDVRQGLFQEHLAPTGQGTPEAEAHSSNPTVACDAGRAPAGRAHG